MGRFRKTFKEALEYSKELMSTKNMNKEKAAKKAALVFGEDEQQLLSSLNGERLNHKDLKTEKKEDSTSTKKKTHKTTKKTAASVTNEEVTSKKFEYNGPVDIICLNGNVSTINICEVISGEDVNDAKERLYEKLFNNRLPIFIRKNNWSKCLHEL